MTKAELDSIQMNLSFSYLHAVVSKAGGGCVQTGKTEDDMGIDAKISFKGEFSRKPLYSAFNIDVQLKSSRQKLAESDENISYSLKKKQYDKYTSRSSHESILVLFCLPDAPELWLAHSEEELILRKCAYWTSLKGAPPCKNDSITIHFPKRNVFDVEHLHQILAVLSKGKGLSYGS